MMKDMGVGGKVVMYCEGETGEEKEGEEKG
jgi:hypothetical protein